MKPGTCLIIACSFISPFISCTNDKIEPVETDAACANLTVTYTNQVKKIIDSSCAYSGCHVPGGIGVGNYTTYGGILPFLQSEAFRDRVLVKKNNPAEGMPPNKSIYRESKKDDLTNEELLFIKCWLNAGFPQ